MNAIDAVLSRNALASVGTLVVHIVGGSFLGVGIAAATLAVTGLGPTLI